MKEPYKVSSIETIVDVNNVRVRQFTMKAEEVVPWHSHTEVTDITICLTGVITLEIEGEEATVLLPGARSNVAPCVIHRVVNTGGGESSYLLIQFGGKYDFVKKV